VWDTCDNVLPWFAVLRAVFFFPKVVFWFCCVFECVGYGSRVVPGLWTLLALLTVLQIAGLAAILVPEVAAGAILSQSASAVANELVFRWPVGLLRSESICALLSI
jgi:hypothetical protein